MPGRSHNGAAHDPQSLGSVGNAQQPLSATPRRAGILQVVKTLFFVMIMVGSRKTWEGDGDGARMTPTQVVIGGIIAGVVIVLALITLVRVILGMATP